MRFSYGLEDKPPFGHNLLYGLQWLIIALPSILITGKIMGAVLLPDPVAQVLFLQKTTFMVGLTLLVQILWGHRLPLIVGPASALLIGVIASQGFAPAAVYSAIFCGGAVLSLISWAGLFGHLQRLFTPRVVAVVLLLIAFTLLPAIGDLLIDRASGTPPLQQLSFALVFIIVLFVAQRKLKGVWQATLILWAMLIGSLLHRLLLPPQTQTAPLPLPLVAGFFHDLNLQPVFAPGVLLSFAFCFLALAVNDLGSIQALDDLLKPGNMPRRLNRGLLVTGLANMLSGFTGVVGPVDFSLSPGVILSTRCASRFPLLATAVLLLALAWSPALFGLFNLVPSPVIGCVLLFILFSQVAAGLLAIGSQPESQRYTDGVIIGAAVLLGTLTSFWPPDVRHAFPTWLQPVIGNGFVVGVFAVLLLEHGIFRDSRAVTKQGEG